MIDGSEMPAAINSYSMAVEPCSSAMNRRSTFMSRSWVGEQASNDPQRRTNSTEETRQYRCVHY
jgi:hypothetical protein